MKKEKPKTAEVRIESDGTLIIAVEGLDRILRVMVEQGKRCKMFYTDASTDLSGFIGDSKDSLCEGCENGGFYDKYKGIGRAQDFIDALWDMAFRLIDQQPTIDIVRCKNCKYYIEHKLTSLSYYTCDRAFQHMTGDTFGVWFEPPEDFFCADGERREG